MRLNWNKFKIIIIIVMFNKYNKKYHKLSITIQFIQININHKTHHPIDIQRAINREIYIIKIKKINKNIVKVNIHHIHIKNNHI